MVDFQGILADGAVYLQFFLDKYGLWAFVGASALKGMLLFFIVPAETVTPTYVLLEADNVIEVGIIVLMAASAVTAGNSLIYVLSRLVGIHFIGEATRSTKKWRFMEWAVKEHGRSAMVLSRLVPFVGAWATVPAGIVRLNFRTFLIYSFVGFLIYESLLGFGAYYGVKMGMFSLPGQFFPVSIPGMG